MLWYTDFMSKPLAQRRDSVVFSSLFFVYAFLPISLLIYTLVKGIPAKNAVLLVSSLVFYAWGEPKYVLLLIAMVLADWVLALRIEKAQDKSRKKRWLVLACVVNLGLIGVFKYANFFDHTVTGLLGVIGRQLSVTRIGMNFEFLKVPLTGLLGAHPLLPEIALPIGISFYTFQLLSYVVDVYRGEVPAQKKLHTLLLYASLFHQCIAGPIVRYQDVANELMYRRANAAEVSRGVTRFTIGLAKKAVLANACGNLADLLIKGGADCTAATIEQTDGAALWVSMLAYMFQIYLDFSAYSDMAIGMGQMIGLHYKENFDYPYAADSVTNFWRRWHISLSTFFRDYVYIPLGGNRRGMGRTIFNMFVVWMLTGFWHGASWNFVLWGLYYFVFLTLEKLFLGKWLKAIPKIFGHLYTLIVVYFGWILFRFKDFGMVWATLRGMFGAPHNFWTTTETNATLMGYVFFLAACVIAVLPVARFVGNRTRGLASAHAGAAAVYSVWQIILPVALLFLATMSLVGDSYNPFLYFQF